MSNIVNNEQNKDKQMILINANITHFASCSFCSIWAWYKYPAINLNMPRSMTWYYIIFVCYSRINNAIKTLIHYRLTLSFLCVYDITHLNSDECDFITL